MIVRAAIDRQLAELARVVTPPSGDLYYGRDLSCVRELDPTLAEVDERTVRGIGEAAIRRLTTPRGILPDDPDYGLDVRAFCNRGVTLDELRSLAGRVRLELTKDDRIDEALVEVTAPSSGALSVSIRITPADARAGRTFSLVFAVTSAGVVEEAF